MGQQSALKVGSSQALLIGGRSGVGKSRVGVEIHHQLSVAGVRHCLIEGDFLDMAYPAPWEHGLAELNLAAIWANYRALGYRRLIYTNTASVFGDVINQLTTAMGDDPEAVAVLLTGTDESIRQRLSQRETGCVLNQHLHRSAAMAQLLNSEVPDWVYRVWTDDRAVADIASEVLGLTDWLSATPP